MIQQRLHVFQLMFDELTENWVEKWVSMRGYATCQQPNVPSAQTHTQLWFCVITSTRTWIISLEFLPDGFYWLLNSPHVYFSCDTFRCRTSMETVANCRASAAQWPFSSSARLHRDSVQDRSATYRQLYVTVLNGYSTQILLSDSLVIVQMVISTKYKFRINYLSF